MCGGAANQATVVRESYARCGAQAACGRIFKSNLRSIYKRYGHCVNSKAQAFFDKRSMWFAVNGFQFSHSVKVNGGNPLGKKVIVSLENTERMKYFRLTFATAYIE